MSQEAIESLREASSEWYVENLTKGQTGQVEFPSEDPLH